MTRNHTDADMQTILQLAGRELQHESSHMERIFGGLTYEPCKHCARRLGEWIVTYQCCQPGRRIYRGRGGGVFFWTTVCQVCKE
jgi:hypothetical protein